MTLSSTAKDVVSYASGLEGAGGLKVVELQEDSASTI
jgi:hypothetical protein